MTEEEKSHKSPPSTESILERLSNDELSEKDLEELVSLLPEDEKQKTERLIRVSQYFQGRLPHPEHFKEYEDILPGSAERILTELEQREAHRQKIELRQLEIMENLGSKESRRLDFGQRAGVAVMVLFAVVGLVLGLYGHTESAIAAFAPAGINSIRLLINPLVQSRSKEDSD